MRVVAGVARGRRLRAPVGRSTRPTSDRVREAVFNVLVGLDALDGAAVVDLFAGSGALGIEALSRGAASATFVDHDRRALAVVRANLDATDLADRAVVVRSDARRYLERADAHDLAFLDPPYAFDDWPALLSPLPAGLAVLESDRPVEVGPAWEILRRKRYGTTVVTVARRRTTDQE